MKHITFDRIKSLNINVSDLYGWTLEMLEKKDRAVLPPKISIKPFDGAFCNVMPSLINTSKYYGGVKIVTRYPGRVPSLDSDILLMNAQSGELVALMDGNWITAMRTGCVTAHSIMLLAKSNYKNIALMGLGNVTRAAVLVLLEKNPDRDFYFKILKYKGQEELFAKRFKDYSNFKYEFIDDTNTLIKGSDVVISGVTFTNEDFCSDDAYDDGVLVVPIHTRGFTNCDLFFDKVFADDYGHVCHFKNFEKFKSFNEISDVINGKAAGRESDKERILVYNIGISIHDINFAAHVYEMIKDDPNLLEIEMTGPTDKFWI